MKVSMSIQETDMTEICVNKTSNSILRHRFLCHMKIAVKMYKDTIICVHNESKYCGHSNLWLEYFLLEYETQNFVSS